MPFSSASAVHYVWQSLENITLFQLYSCGTQQHELTETRTKTVHETTLKRADNKVECTNS